MKQRNSQSENNDDYIGNAPDNPDQPDDPNQNESDEPGLSKDEIGAIKEIGAVTVGDGRHTIHCLSIIGQVEGHYILPSQNKTTKYEHVIPQLVAIEQSPDIEGLLIILNTVGGDVEAGLAIAELIAGMKKPTVSLVLGGRTLDRRTAGRLRPAELYCPVGHHDHPPRADERPGSRGTANPRLF